MTRAGPAKPADASAAAGRLDNARAFLAAARTVAVSAKPGDNANPITSLAASAAMAYADALTARFGGRINQKDHAAARTTLRTVLGNRLPKAQDRQLARLLERKDEAQYGTRWGNLAEARRLLDDLEGFAAWAEAAVAEG